MENSFGKIISILLLIMMIYFVPLKYYMEKNQALGELYVSTKTIELVDAVRNTGFVTKDMYEQYLSQISKMNKLYKIKLEHTMVIKTEESKTEEGNTEESNIPEKQHITDIEMDIYHNGIYTFHIDDYFKIQVTDSSTNKLISYYGGYIKNEAY